MLENLGRDYLNVYQRRFRLGEIFNNCIRELIKSCDVMWTTLELKFERCYPLTFSVCYVHLVWFITIDCNAPTAPGFSAKRYFEQIFSFFVKYVVIFLHQMAIWYSPVGEACISTPPFISLSIEMKHNQATFLSFQLVSLSSCLAVLTEAAQLWPVGLSAPYLMTHAQPTASRCTLLFNQSVAAMLVL